MDALEINKEYIDLIQSDPEKYFKDYGVTFGRVENSNIKYKGKPVPFLYHPMFFTEKDIENFDYISNMIISISNKVTNHYIKNKEFRKKFGFPKLIEDLIEVDNGYDINVPIGRFDIFYKDLDNFMFCEINTDGSSAMYEDNGIGGFLLDSEGLKDLGEIYELDYFELIDSWVEKSIEILNKYDPDESKHNVAIVDFVESGTSAEFDEFMKAYKRHGYNCIIVDPRDLTYRDGALYKDDYKIDMVYRRIVTFELIEKAEEIPDFIEAYKNRAFCCVGSIRSQVVHNKIIFKILHDEDSLDLLTEEEREFVNKHIPVTGLFEGDMSIFDMVLNNKDKYIMKPKDMNASQGVFAGRDLSPEEWEKKIRGVWNTHYIYQEFYEPIRRDHIVFKDGKPKVDSFKSIVGMFIYKEEFAGLYTRIGKNNIISGVTDYYTLPNILVKR